MPRSISWAQGLAFIATVESASYAKDPGQWTYDFQIEKVVVPNAVLAEQGFVAGQVAHVVTTPCGPIRNLKEGHGYLITTYPGFSGFSSQVTFVWEVAGERVALVWMYGGKVYDYTEERGSFVTHVDDAVVDVGTLSEAIFLITHGSLPETDTASSSATEASEPSWWLLVPVSVVAFVLINIRRRTRTTP